MTNAARQTRPRSISRGIGIDGHAIGAARHDAVLNFRIGIEFARQEPADDKQHDDDAERHQ